MRFCANTHAVIVTMSALGGMSSFGVLPTNKYLTMSHRATSHSNIEPTAPLSDIATRNVVQLAPGDSVGDAARVMAEKRISSIVVTDETGHPTGIITERNILEAVRAGAPLDTPLRHAVTTPVIVISGTADCMEAYRTCLREGIRHLVLTNDDGVLSGVVSETDFRLHLNLTALAGRRKVTAVAKRSAIALPPGNNLMQALDLMQSQQKSCVVVIEQGRPVGIVTERDVVRLYSKGVECDHVVLSDVMVFPVLTVSDNASTNEAAEQMLAHKVRHLVVVDDLGNMVGLVSEHDLTQSMVFSLAEERAGIEETFLHTLIDTIPDLIWLKDVDGIYLACNHRFEQFFGAAEKDIVGKGDYDFMPKEQAEFFRGYDRKAMEKNAPSVNEEWVTYASDGHRELLETIKTPMRDSRGRLIGVLGVARDITERKRVENALYFVAQRGWKDRAENFFDALVQYLGESLGVDYVIIDRLDSTPGIAETIALYAKGGIAPNMRYDLKGTPCENVIGKDFCCYPSDAQKLFPSDALLAEMGIESYAGIPLWDSTGQALGLIAVMHSQPLQDEAMLTQVLSIVATRAAAELERKLSEGRLRESETKYRQLFETAGDGIFIQNASGFIDCNEKGAAMYGLAREQIIGRSPSALAPDRQPGGRLSADFAGEMVAATMGGVPQTFEWQALRADGTLLDVEVALSRSEIKGEDCLQAVVRDISVRKRAEIALRESEEKLRNLYELSPLGIALTDMSGRYVEFNGAFQRICGYSRDELNALDYWALTPKKYSADEAAQLESLARTGRYGPYEKEYIQKSGALIPLRLNGVLVTGRDGQRYIWSIVEDITVSKMVEANLRITASVFDNTQEAIIITDADNAIIDVNPAFTAITGYSRDDVLGRNPKILSSGRQDKDFYAGLWAALKKDKVWRGEMWNRRKSGEVYAEMLSISAICDEAGNVQRHVGVFSDITYFKNHEAELSRIANYDALTGVPNRRLLADRLRQAIAHAQRNRKMLAICYLDLDGFKDVNDQYGHEAGDILLVDVSRRLQEMLRAGDTLARLGGDEFVVLFNDLSREQECYPVLDRILSVVAMPVNIGGAQATVSASIGVSFYPAENVDGDTLLRHADQAMYVAKQHGKNRYHLYDSEHDQRVRSLHESRRRILQGIENKEFELFYQPKIELTSGEVIGVEALIRWHHPEQGLLLPAEFLPFIEDSDLEIKLGCWVMDTALAQIDAWSKQGFVTEVSINISARHLQSPSFVSELARRLERYPGMPRNKLQIEVLETAALEDIVQSSETIEACHKLGVSFALDDFGTGYSSLSYLRKLSAETLKIDQSFVQGMLTNEGDRAIVQGIIALAKSFGRKTIAEGMEAKELTQLLIDVGCMYGQGYGIARPMAADDLLKWKNERQ